MATRHSKVSAIADGADTSLVRPSDWNAAHLHESEDANKVFSGPISGVPAAPLFRFLVDADIPAAIARDAEVTAAVTAHEALGDPHPVYLTDPEHIAIGPGGDPSPHHRRLTLGLDASLVLGLSGADNEVLNLDSQLANQVLAGPTSGGSADPFFRALVDADVPATIMRDAEHTAIGGSPPHHDESHDHSTGLSGSSLNPITLKLQRTDLTISAGAVTLTNSHHRIDTESAAATDDLDTITNISSNILLVIHPVSAARTIVVKHGTGNILCVGGSDITLDDEYDFAILIYDGTTSKWFALSSGGGGGSPVGISEDAGASLGNLTKIDFSSGFDVGFAAGVGTVSLDVTETPLSRLQRRLTFMWGDQEGFF